MHNPNIQSLQTDRRFQALIKQEMIEHQAIISSHHLEMKQLRELIHGSMEKFDSLFKHCEQQLKDKNDVVNDLISCLQVKIKAQEMHADDQKKTLLSLFQQMHDIYELHVSKTDLFKIKADIETKINQINVNQINSFQHYQQEVKSWILSLKNDIATLKTNVGQSITVLDEKIENRSSLSSMDKEGILKEIRVYERSMFIIDKQIEHIFTAIERINKKIEILNQRGEVCHKPDW